MDASAFVIDSQEVVYSGFQALPHRPWVPLPESGFTVVCSASRCPDLLTFPDDGVFAGQTLVDRLTCCEEEGNHSLQDPLAMLTHDAGNPMDLSLPFIKRKSQRFRVEWELPLSPDNEKLSHVELVKIKGCLFTGILPVVEGWVTDMQSLVASLELARGDRLRPQAKNCYLLQETWSTC